MYVRYIGDSSKILVSWLIKGKQPALQYYTVIERNIYIKQLIQPWLRHENDILKVHAALCESVQYTVLPQEQGTSIWSFLPFAYFVYLVKLSNLEHFFIFLNKKQEEKRDSAKHQLGLLVLAKEVSETDCCFRVWLKWALEVSTILWQLNIWVDSTVFLAVYV